MQGNNKQQHQEQLHYLLQDSGASTHVVLEATRQIYHCGLALLLRNFTRSQSGKALSTESSARPNFKIMTDPLLRL